ncbi:MAG: MFS transporter [Marinilabiliaceae bacterium]|nr:MFS transporter [Marinilabiliaceae bacterium]
MEKLKPLRFLPSLYIYQAIPYSIVMTTSVVMYQALDISASSYAFWTSLLYLPWTIKPLWSPIIEKYGTKREWIIWTQTAVALLFITLAFSLKSEIFYPLSLTCFLLIAFTSASHDIACDGYYMLALNTKQQNYFVGFRSTFYRIGSMAAVGAIPILVHNISGFVENKTEKAWLYSLIILAITLAALMITNALTMPHPPSDMRDCRSEGAGIYSTILKSFFSKYRVIPAMLFILLYRFGEAQLSKIAPSFLLAETEKGGLEMSMDLYGIMYGTAGIIALTTGGILGGIYVAHKGLEKSLWPMALCMNIPNIAYVLLSIHQPESCSLSVWSAIIIEQFGYGFGFTSYMLFLIHYVRNSQYKTAEYALATGIMALGMMLPGMISGFVADTLGYQGFFVYILICTIPGMAVIPFLSVKEEK